MSRFKSKKYIFNYPNVISSVSILGLILLWAYRERAGISFDTMMIMTGIGLAIISLGLLNIKRQKQIILDKKAIEESRKQIDENLNDEKGF